MRRRLLASTALIALAAVALLGVPLGVVGGRLVRGAATDRLEREADEVAGALDDRVESGAPVRRALLDRLAPAGREVVVRLPDGATVHGGARLGGEVVRVAATGGPAVVSVLAPESEVDHRTDAVWLAVLVLSLAAVALAVALARAQSRRLARPLERLARRSGQLGTPAFAGADAGASGLPEVDAVGAALDRASERIARLLAREREFSANASHQLRTPLTALRLHLEELERGGAGAGEARAALGQADRLQAVIAELERLAREGEAGEREEVDAAAVVAEQARAWAGAYEAAGRALVVSGADDAPLPAVTAPGALRQAVDVLLDNALRHGKGRVTVGASRTDGVVRVRVADEGPGVPEPLAARVFERRVSLAGGSGLGLALARELLEAGGGSLRLVSATPPCFEATVAAGGAAR